jgi:hypothetical protein
VEGRITILWLDIIRIDLQQWSPWKLVEKWGVGFIKSLLSITHKQWIFQNLVLHHRIEGLTSNDHLILFNQIRALMQTHPTDLLPCHRYLLTRNFQSLGSSETIQRQIWVALMESALSAAAQVTLGCFTPGSLAIFDQTPLPTCIRRSSNHSQYTVCVWPPSPHRLQQQTLPASFW